MNDQSRPPKKAAEPKVKKEPDIAGATPEPTKIEKPKAGFLNKFKSKRKPEIAGVQTLLTPLPIRRIGEIDDWFQSHPDEAIGWTPEMCFTDVPIIGEKNTVLHLIDEDLAVQYLPAKKIKRQRLALAAMPGDKFFFGIVPSQNVNHSWNESALEIYQRAKTEWMQAISRKAEGIERYQPKVTHDPNPFPAPNWPIRTLEDLEALLTVTFSGHSIETPDHPALLRLIGGKQNLT